jgi:excisionase family DNA binding protein
MTLMNMAELMEFLKVRRSTVYKLRDEGLPTIHLGRVVRFDREEIIRWLKDRQRSEPPRAGELRLEEEEILL